MTEETISYFEQSFANHFAFKKEEQKLLIDLIKANKNGALSIPLPSNCNLPKDAPVVLHQGRVFLKRNFELLHQTLNSISQFAKTATKSPDKLTLESSLYPSQEKALNLAMHTPLMLLSGGPGSGKSFTAKSIIEMENKLRPNSRIIATAPTGKALGPIANASAITKTLHALLGIHEHDALDKSPLPIFADLILVDECSMIELPIWRKFFQSVSPKARIVLMGDSDQLPPIEGWSLFSFLLRDKTLPHVFLDQMKRSESSSLLNLFTSVKKKDAKLALSYLEDPSIKEVSILPLEIPTTHFKEDTTYLSPFKMGPFGVDAINAKISRERSKYKKRPIMITKNDYNIGLMNGELGYLEGSIATFQTAKGPCEFPQSLLPPYEEAFAISIHKSQGSEFDHVHIFLPEESLAFSGSLLYTAITRAKKTVTISTTKEVLIKMIEKMEQIETFDSLDLF